MADSTTAKNSLIPQGWILDEDPIKLHQFDGTLLDACREDICNLSLGQPGPEFLRLCSHVIQEATRHRLEIEKQNCFIFQYGPPTGIYSYRIALSKFLTARYRDQVLKEHLFLTCGATSGLHIITSQLLAARPVIFVEDATFMIALDTFNEMPDAKIVSVPMTPKGIDPAALEIQAEKEWKKWNEDSRNVLTKLRPYWAILYTMPIYHNPTGINLSRDVAESVVEITQRFGILTLADDVYNLLHYREGPPPPRLFSIARDIAKGRAEFLEKNTKPAMNPPLPEVAVDAIAKGHVLSNGTFSKFLSPGIRVGWIEAPGVVIANLRDRGIFMGGGAVNHYMSGIVASALDLGLVDKHVDFLVKTLAARMNILCDILERELPPQTGCHFQRPTGGYFVWLQLPQGTDAAAALKYAEQTFKVSAIAGEAFAADKVGEVTRYRNCIRIAISFHNENRISVGAKALARALREYLQI